jgi:hypothetical protein
MEVFQMSLIIPPSDTVQDNEPPKTRDKDPNCTMCRHFDPQPHIPAPNGYCVRFPPIVHVVGMQQGALAGQMIPVTQQFCPQVSPMFICGEFSPPNKDIQ